MPRIGDYSHQRLVSIICKLIGKAHGTNGCFEFDASGTGDGGVESVGVQTITSGDARVNNSTNIHFGTLAIGEDAVLSITEPYGTLEIV